MKLHEFQSRQLRFQETKKNNLAPFHCVGCTQCSQATYCLYGVCASSISNFASLNHHVSYLKAFSENLEMQIYIWSCHSVICLST